MTACSFTVRGGGRRGDYGREEGLTNERPQIDYVT